MKISLVAELLSAARDVTRQTVEAVVDGLPRLERLSFDVHRHAEQFDEVEFQRRMRAFVEEAARAPRRLSCT